MRVLTLEERAMAAAGVALYAHWKDGQQYVGTCGRTLKEATRGIMEGREDANILMQAMVATNEAY